MNRQEKDTSAGHKRETSSETSGKPSTVKRTIPSNELLQGEQEILIEHGGELYRLRLTRNGKLILHK